MRTLRTLALFLALAPVWLAGQARHAGGLDPATIRQPLSDSWPVYSGDYTGQRFSALKQVDRKTVKNLALAWVARLTAGTGAGPVTAGRGGAPGAGGPPATAGGGPSMIVGGVGTGELSTNSTPNIKGSILMVDDVLYVTAPDNVWAIDAHDGRVRWQYYWKTRGGTHIGNRGAALRYNTLFFETPDNYLVALDAQDRPREMARRDCRFRAAVLLDASANRRRQPRHRRHRQRSRCAGLSAVLRRRDRQAAVEAVHGADEPWRPRDWRHGRISTRRGTAAATHGFRARTIRRRGCTSSGPAIRRPHTPASPGRATTFSRAHWSR